MPYLKQSDNARPGGMKETRPHKTGEEDMKDVHNTKIVKQHNGGRWLSPIHHKVCGEEGITMTNQLKCHNAAQKQIVYHLVHIQDIQWNDAQLCLHSKGNISCTEHKIWCVGNWVSSVVIECIAVIRFTMCSISACMAMPHTRALYPPSTAI